MRGDTRVIDLQGPVALVRAASKGLGAEIVRELAKRGADVAFTYLRDEVAAADGVHAVESMGHRAVAIRAAAAADFPRRPSFNKPAANWDRSTFWCATPELPGWFLLRICGRPTGTKSSIFRSKELLTTRGR